MKLEKEDTLKEPPRVKQHLKMAIHDSFLNNGSEPFEQFLQLFQNISAAVYTCDKDGLITMYNEAAVNLWGRRPEIGKDLWCGSWKIFHPDGRPMALADCPMALTLKEGRPIAGHEIVVERPDGKRKYVLPQPRPLFDTTGKLTGAVNVLVDITELREVHARVAESEERFKALAENSPVAVWMLDSKGNCTYLNPEWSRMTGVPNDKGLGQGWADLIHPDDLSMGMQMLNEALVKQTKLDLTLRLLNHSKNYSKVRAVGNPQFDEHGELLGYVGTVEDITQHEMTRATLEKEVELRTKMIRQQSEELRKSDERYHGMIQEVEDYAIILLDQEGTIQNWNKGAEKIKGYRAEEIVGKTFREFYTPEDRAAKLPDQLLALARVEGRASHEGWRIRKDGTTFWGSVVITALHDEAGNVTGFSKVTRDLTEKKLADEDLKNKSIQILEKNKELESMNQELASFAYVSSHDLQEPLRKIQTFASRIVETEHENLSPKGKDYFIRMQNAALRMQTLIEDLLTYSRTNTADKNFEMIDLNKLIAEIRTELRESIDDKKAVIESSPLPTLNIIKFQFRQLITNLVSNSLKFSRPNHPPHVWITAEVVKGNEIKNKYANPKKVYHHISVKDNGIGFEPEHKNKIFEVFQRLHGRSEYTGTGIGLAICKKVVENHGGFISAESQLDQGATFDVYIPQT